MKIVRNGIGLFILVFFVLTGCNQYDDDVPPAGFGETLKLNEDNYITNMNQEVRLDVLANDLIGLSGSLHFQNPAHGTIKTDERGFMYKPAVNFSGTDIFYYRFCHHNNSRCDSARVIIKVEAPAPTDNYFTMKF